MYPRWDRTTWQVAVPEHWPERQRELLHLHSCCKEQRHSCCRPELHSLVHSCCKPELHSLVHSCSKPVPHRKAVHYCTLTSVPCSTWLACTSEPCIPGQPTHRQQPGRVPTWHQTRTSSCEPLRTPQLASEHPVSCGVAPRRPELPHSASLARSWGVYVDISRGSNAPKVTIEAHLSIETTLPTRQFG